MQASADLLFFYLFYVFIQQRATQHLQISIIVPSTCNEEFCIQDRFPRAPWGGIPNFVSEQCTLQGQANVTTKLKHRFPGLGEKFKFYISADQRFWDVYHSPVGSFRRGGGGGAQSCALQKPRKLMKSISAPAPSQILNRYLVSIELCDAIILSNLEANPLNQQRQ